MGGKKKKPEVSDFLMSVDYGMCFGPVDSINQIWVKDKPIFCGSVKDRMDMQVSLNDLFGGDEREGGVSGVVEVYVGDDEQISSEALAGRFNRVPANFPGYRGLAHLFFRGGGAVSQAERLRGFQFVLYELKRRIMIAAGTIIPITVPAIVPSNPGTGFKWGTNNPYMPATKVHYTRIPRDLDPDTAVIYPFSHYDETTGDPVPFDDFLLLRPGASDSVSIELDALPGGPLTINLLDFFTPTQIDSGGLQITTTQSADAVYYGLAGSGPAPGVIAAYASFKDETSTDIGGSVSLGGDTDTGHLEYTSTVVIPGSSRSIVVTPQFVLFLPIFSLFNNKYFKFDITPIGGSGGGGGGGGNSGAHCDIDGAGLRMMPNANPAHIIYECLTNAEWGKGEDPANINAASFAAAAQTLKDELFGIYVTWNRQTEIESFIQEILDHVQAVLFLDPQTGQWMLRLLRADYDAASAPLLDPSNCKVKNGRRRLWGETVNEIVVTWTDPMTEKSATLASHNLGNIAVQGGVLSETRDYYGIRDPWLAQRVADRDVQSAGAPLYTSFIEVDRSQWRVRPGDVRRFSWPQDGIAEMVLRVMAVDYGKPKDRVIKLSVVEDIFALEQTAYGSPQRSEWVSDRAQPEAFDSEFGMTAPLPVMLRGGVSLTEVDDNYPTVAVLLIGWNDAVPVADFDAVGDVTLANGSTELRTLNTIAPTRSWLTDSVMVPEAATVLPGVLVARFFLGDESPGDFILIGESEAQHELVMLDTFDDVTGDWTVARGVYDTIPAPWPLGTRAWAFPDSGNRGDPTQRAAGEAVTYRFLPRTTEGRLAYNDAADVDFVGTERPFQPFRPADTQLDGNGFGLTDYTATGTPVSVTATWVNRNRTTEDQVALRWADANVTGEVGQTTVLRILDFDGGAQNELTGLTGTTYTVTAADFAGVVLGSVEFLSEVGGLRSRVGARRAFDFVQIGYGRGYGRGYGQGI